MIQQSHFWEYTQKNWKQGLKQIYLYNHFIVALFTTAKRWKQPKCPSVDGCDEWINKMWYIYTIS